MKIARVAGAVMALVVVACGGSTGGGGGGAQGAEGDSSQKAGTVATDFVTRDVDGKMFRLSDHLGREVILLDFWSTYCQPCTAEMPHLRRMYEQHKAKGFVVIGISMDGPETIAEVPAFTKRNGMTFPVVLDEDSQIASVYNPKKSAPLSVLIDKSGKVVKVHEGYNPGDEDIIGREVAQALDQPAPTK